MVYGYKLYNYQRRLYIFLAGMPHSKPNSPDPGADLYYNFFFLMLEPGPHLLNQRGSATL
jgi:hypothetical protein